MFGIINGLIMDQSIVEEVFRVGFEHLGEVSPFNRGTVVFSQRSNVWRAYLLEENPGLIKPTGEDGQYSIDHKSKEFVNLISEMDFLQINSPIKSFNHLEAIRFFDSL